MTVTTISGAINQNVALDQGNYGYTLTITKTAKITAPSVGVLTAPTTTFFTINNAGTINAGTFGVGVAFNADIYNTGVIFAPVAGVFLTAGNLVNAGSIAGTDAGLFISGKATGYSGRASATNTASGIISGNLVGVYIAPASAQATFFDNAGTVFGQTIGIYSVYGLISNSNRVSGGTYGIYVQGGRLTNTGTIFGGDAGISLNQTAGDTFSAPYTAQVKNYGYVSGAVSGITFNSATPLGGGNGEITNYGTIKGSENGIEINNGYVINTGIVSGVNIGVSLQSGVIANSGTISGSNYAIYGDGKLSLYLNGGTVIGKVKDRSNNGRLFLQGSQETALKGLGTTFSGFSYISLAQNASITLEGNLAGLVSGQTITDFTLGDTIILDGFSATSESISAAGLVLNNGSATKTLGITGAGFTQDFSLSSGSGNSTIVFEQPAISTISTYVPIPIQTGYGQIAKNLTIANTGTVKAIYTEHVSLNDTTTNFGSIENGIFVDYSSTFLNIGVVSGLTPAILGDSSILINKGSIVETGSAANGIYIINAGLINSGKILLHGDAVYLEQGYIRNTGTILGDVKQLTGYLYNSNLITGASIAVIDESFLTSINNVGTISGNSIGISLVSPLFVYLNNSGTIAGGMDGILDHGAQITNSGLISGSSFAIYNNESSLSLIVNPGGRFSGAVKDESGAGIIVLAGSTAGNLDMGTSFTGFSEISFATGVTWAIEGGSISLADGQSIYNFLTSETIILDNFVATSETFIAGPGLILSNPTSSDTINIIGNFSTSEFAFASINGKTEITSSATQIVPISIISSFFRKTAYLGTIYYADNLSITNAGTIIVPAGAPAIEGYASGSHPTIINSGLVGPIDTGNDGTILNLGKIIGNYNVYPVGNTAVYLASGLISNAGIITGPTTLQAYSSGISGTYFTSVVNSGTVENESVGILLNDGTIVNSGLIEGAQEGVSLSGGGTLINAGKIIGGIRAVFLDLIVDPGASFAGAVDVGGGVISLGANTTGSINIGGSFTGFGEISFSPHSTWTLEGSSLSIGDGQTISNFFSGETIILDSFVATSESFVQGTGLVLSAGTAHDTLSIFGNFNTAEFSVTTSAGKTEINSLIGSLIPTSTITAAIRHEVTLGSYYYTPQLTITNTGAVVSNSPISIYGPIAGPTEAITNAGTIGDINAAGSINITNAGTIEGNNPIIMLDGTIINSGLITGNGIQYSETGIDLNYGGLLINSGTITGSDYGVAEFYGTIINSGLISGTSDAVKFEYRSQLVNSGTISGNIKLPEYATITADPGAKFFGAVSSEYESTLALAGSIVGSLDIGTSFTGFSNINFNQGATWSLEAGSIAIADGQMISGFTYGDTIILDHFVVNTLDTTYVSGTGLELTDTLGNQLTLDIVGNFSTASFIVVDPPGDTTIEAICYLRGTCIATPAGDVPIEKLQIGDTVITRFNGYRKIKWIGRQNFSPRFIINNPDQIPVRIAAGALAAQIPTRDLFVSPGHAMLIGKNLILAKNLINGVSVTQPAPSEDVHYYQLEFETHDCVLAEGAWSESYADTPDLRAQFHNRNEFIALFPHHIAPTRQILCAPRPLEGPGLEAALRPLTANAAPRTRPGRLHGFIDDVSIQDIRGWAWDESNPYLPVLLEILVNNHRLGTALACQPRADLKAAGYALGHCGFMFTSPLGLPAEPAQITLRRVSDGATLNHRNRRAA